MMNERNPQRILLVEDDQDIQEVARLALTAVGGYKVDSCSSGKKALERVSTSRPDLILMDVMMPGLDGPATLHALREDPQTANIPVIFMTARVQAHELEQYREMGALGVVSKPFNPMTLSSELSTLWGNQP